MKTIYVKQIGGSWTFCDEYGYCVHADGELAYHPDFFDKRPSGYPLYQEAAQQSVRLTRFPQCRGCEYNPCDLENNSDYCPARR